MKELLGVAVVMVLSGCQCERERSWIRASELEWTPVEFGGQGLTQKEGEVFRIEMGVELSGIRFEAEPPNVPYELKLEARRLAGNDFFCGLTFPVSSDEECLTLILGGWGGGTCGISSVNGKDASENETTFYQTFVTEEWYAIRLLVSSEKIEVFLNGVRVINFPHPGSDLSLRPGSIDLCAPLGLATWQTEAEIRGLCWRILD